MLALDNDAAAIETHKANFRGEAHCANIEVWLETHEVPAADVVIGGPPCQGFSFLNKNRAGDSRRALWEHYLEIADRSGARVFVMENVAELYRSGASSACRSASSIRRPEAAISITPAVQSARLPTK